MRGLVRARRRHGRIRTVPLWIRGKSKLPTTNCSAPCNLTVFSPSRGICTKNSIVWGVAFLEWIRILHDIPSLGPAVEMLHDAHLDGLGLVIPNLDLKRFINPPCIVVGPEFRPAALPGHVKRAAGIQPNRPRPWACGP